MSDRQFLWIFGGIFAGVGAIFFAVGLVFLHHTRTFLATAATAPGEVIALERRGGYHPVVQFQLPDGEPMRFAGQVGQSVEVLYNPEQPRSARIRSFLELWFVATLFTSMGGLFLLIGGVPLLSQFRPR
ncbi:DUF3592 domain-containing protein [Synechococcus sp. C9]|uniref:DUF3592 domain-containing protein n=1 Tax=Synechococcus sp. C9 TaxID=102119 RepID=UPI001FF6D343|nr:DUF3592 domain-containing protein [Synechococcus sp. C9]